MVRKPGSKHSAPSSRVTARRNDWNSIRVLHQGPRPPAASRGRIHDRSPIRLPKHQKSLADRGPSIHDGIGCRALLQNTSTSETSDPKYISPLLRGAESAVIAVRSASDEAIHVRSVGTRLDCLRSLSSGGTSCRPGGSHDGTGIQADTSAVSCGARLRYRNGSRLAAGCDSAHFIGVAPPDLP
jgi:hypothetical protein